MPLTDINNPEYVLKAIEEYDRLGRDSFLARYGFGSSKKYHLIYNGKTYDSKAIVGVAHKYARPDLGPLTSGHHFGGLQGAIKVLEKLGFNKFEDFSRTSSIIQGRGDRPVAPTSGAEVFQPVSVSPKSVEGNVGGYETGSSLGSSSEESIKIIEAMEGDAFISEVKFRYRNRDLIEQRKKLSDYRCEVCGITLEEIYGDIGKIFIVAHHNKPIKMGPRKVSLKHIDLVCPNCHAMLHRKDPPFTIQELSNRMKVKSGNVKL